MLLKAKQKPYFVGGQLADLGGRAAARAGLAPRSPTSPQFPMSANTCTGSGSTNTKGSYIEVITATSDDAYALMISLPNNNHARDALIDIAIGGAGSEVVVINNIFASSPKVTFRYPIQAIYPIFIPRGSRIAARCQSTVASNTQGVWITPYYVNPFPRIYRTIETMGAATGDSGGTSIDPGGSANTKGSFVQMVAATTRRIRSLNLIFGNQNNAVRTDYTWYYDIAVGGAGSEVNVVGDLRLIASSASDYANPCVYQLLPVDIPAGSRVSVRCQCSGTDATDRLADVVLYGSTV